MTSTSTRSDEAVIRSLLLEAYQALDFDPGSRPEWDEFAAVFHERALLGLRVFPKDPRVRVMNLGEYVDAQMENNLSAQGYSETPGECEVTVLADVAVARQQFTMNFANVPPVEAVDLFSLVRGTDGWRIVCVVSDALT